MDKKSVYLASPYTIGDKVHNVYRHIRAMNQLLDAGYMVFAPLLSHFANEIHRRGYEDWLELDLYFLQKCDYVCRLSGESPGADREVALAHEKGIPVLTIEALIDLATEQKQTKEATNGNN